MFKGKNKRLGDMLVESGVITVDQLSKALQLQRNTGRKLGEVLTAEGLVDEKTILNLLEVQLGIQYLDLEKYYIDPEIPRLVGENIVRKHCLIPVCKESGKLVVAMSDPLDIFAADDAKIASGCEIKPVISKKQDILAAIEQYYGKQSAEKAIEDFKKQYDLETMPELENDVLNEVNNAPVVRLVNSLISQAVKAKASDIHIEPYEEHIRVRFRVDGELLEIMTPSKSTHSAIVTRIKIMGKMDIAEKRVPQDGRVETVIDGREIDMRISVLPTVHGEKIVIRMLDRSGFMLTRSQLGFSDANLSLFDKIIKNPHGIILVTGPTGSGKTTTLYAILKELNRVESNIITVEDPVEYKFEGVNQVQVNNKAGLTFASGLRSILRQDPDIIMIGEIRDSETVQMAVRAAITGHLVLSTMHTNDSVSTVTRLIDMGVEPYLVSSSVVGVISQRLVRKICSGCKTEYEAEPYEQKLFDLEKGARLQRGAGCSACSGKGYKGRTSVHEIMLVNRELRMLVDTGASMDTLRNAACGNGTVLLKENCRQLVLAGITTTQEYLKVAYSLD